LRRHPGDYVLAGLAAESLFAQRDPRSIKLIARALAMNPYNGGLHQVAGRMLARSQKPRQSAVEFAAAARWAPDVGPVVFDVLRVFSEPDDIARALPVETLRARRIVEALGPYKQAALAYALRVTAVHPSDANMQCLLAETAVAAGRFDLAVQAGSAAWERSPTARHAAEYASALRLAGRPTEATAVLYDALDRTQSSPAYDRLVCYFDLSSLLIQSGDMPAARSVLERAAAVAGGSRALRIAVHDRAADLEDRMGNTNQAEWERAQARELSER
jgi:tetratricopeptide (TPR) repeat protein